MRIMNKTIQLKLKWSDKIFTMDYPKFSDKGITGQFRVGSCIDTSTPELFIWDDIKAYWTYCHWA